MEAIDTLLRVTPPEHQLLMREVPSFGTDVEAALLARFPTPWPEWKSVNEHPLTSDWSLLCVLAYRGGAASVTLLTNVLAHVFREYHVLQNGRRTARPNSTPNETALNGMLYSRTIFLPKLIGVLAVREDAALEFLLRASHPVFWRNLASANDRKALESLPFYLGSSLVGLGLSGRAEAKEVLQDYYDHPERTMLQPERYCFAGSVVDMAFIMAEVRKRGVEVTMDEVLIDVDRGLSCFQEWKQSADGQRWRKWDPRAYSFTQP